MLNHRSQIMQSPNKIFPPTIVATAPSSFADTRSTSANTRSVPHTSPTSKLHVDMIEDNNDEDCEYPANIKSLGPTFRGVEELVSHPKADNHSFGSVSHMASSSVSSSFDYDGEYKDYKHTQGILIGMGGECEELARLPYTRSQFRAEMPDGSNMIMAEFHDAYAKHHTGSQGSMVTKPATRFGKTSWV